jgi:hypothetical protein
VEAQPLNDRLKIEYSKKALEADGIAVSSLVPVEINPGNVRWGPEETRLPTYRVNIDQDNATVRCRVYKVK